MSEPNIQIREAGPDDAAALLAIYTPFVEETAITFEYEVPSATEFRARIEKTKKKYPYLVAICDDEVAGYAYAGAFKERAAYDFAVETSIYVKQGLRRSGIGSMLYAALEKELREMGIQNMEACIGVPEVEDEYLTCDSVHFHEHLGFRMVGEFYKCGFKFGRWYNMAWMEKHIGEHGTQPKVTWKGEM